MFSSKFCDLFWRSYFCYQIDSNYPALHNAYAQYTSAGSGQLSSTTESTNFGVGGQTYAHQYADQTASYEQAQQQQQQIPTYDSQQQYYPQTLQTEQYATPSFQQNHQDTQQQYVPAMQPPYQEQSAAISAPLPEEQQIATPVKQQLPPQVQQQPVPTTQQPPASNIDLLSGLDFASADLTITAPPLQPTSLVPAPITLIPKRIVEEPNHIPVASPAPVAASIQPASFSLVDDKIK